MTKFFEASRLAHYEIALATMLNETDQIPPLKCVHLQIPKHLRIDFVGASERGLHEQSPRDNSNNKAKLTCDSKLRLCQDAMDA